MICRKCNCSYENERYCPICFEENPEYVEEISVADLDDGKENVENGSENIAVSSHIEEEDPFDAVKLVERIFEYDGEEDDEDENAPSVNSNTNNSSNVNTTAVEKNKATGKKKKSRILPIFIVVVVIIAIYYYTRPMVTIERAFVKDDFVTVDKYYNKLTDSIDREMVEERAMDLCRSYYDDYILYIRDYFEVSYYFTLFGENILLGNSEFEQLNEQLDNMNISRNCWEEAEQAFANGDFEYAKVQYQSVIVDDTNYDEAQEKIQQCIDELLPDVLGRWSGDKYVRYTLGYKMPVKVVYYFLRDNLGKVAIEKTNDQKAIDAFYKDYADCKLKKLAKDNNMTVAAVERALTGGKSSYIDYVKKKDVYGELFDKIAFGEDFVYSGDKQDIEIDYNDGSVEIITMDGDTIKIANSNYSKLADIGLEQDITLER